VHCGDKFTTLTCYTEKSNTENVKNTDIIRRKSNGLENMNINTNMGKINNTEKNLYNLTETGYYEKMDDILEKYQNKKGNFVVSEKKEIPDSVEHSEKVLSHEDVGNVLLSLLARVSDLQIRNLDLTPTEHSDICDIDNYTDRKYGENVPEKASMLPSVSQLGLTLPYGIECTHVTFGCLLTVIEKDYFTICEDLGLCSNPAEFEKMKRNENDIDDDIRDNRAHSGTFRGSKISNISAEFPSPSRTPDIFRRGIRRASSNLHEAKVKSNDNIPGTKGYVLPKYFSTPSTPPSQTPVLSSIDPRAFSGSKPLISPLRATHRPLFTSLGPLLNALTILKANLCLLSHQISTAERTQSNTVAEGEGEGEGEAELREISSTALEVDVRAGSAVHRPDWVGSPTQSDVNGAGTKGNWPFFSILAFNLPVFFKIFCSHLTYDSLNRLLKILLISFYSIAHYSILFYSILFSTSFIPI
jgi:hypothetical protein